MQHQGKNEEQFNFYIHKSFAQHLEVTFKTFWPNKNTYGGHGKNASQFYC